MLVVTSQTQTHRERDSYASREIINRNRDTLRERDSCARCDIADRQRRRHSEKETAVPVVTSRTDRDADTQRKRQLCPL